MLLQSNKTSYETTSRSSGSKRVIPLPQHVSRLGLNRENHSEKYEPETARNPCLLAHAEIGIDQATVIGNVEQANFLWAARDTTLAISRSVGQKVPTIGHGGPV